MSLDRPGVHFDVLRDHHVAGRPDRAFKSVGHCGDKTPLLQRGGPDAVGNVVNTPSAELPVSSGGKKHITLDKKEFERI